MSATDRRWLRGFRRPKSQRRRLVLAAIAAPAFVAAWSGWVSLGKKAGFGPVDLLPGITKLEIDTAITLPIGIEAYAAYALGVWLSSREMSKRTRNFAMISGISSLAVGALGQVAYHVLETFKIETAPWWIVVGVAILPIAIVGMVATLLHMLRADDEAAERQAARDAAKEAAREARKTAPSPIPAPRETESEPAAAPDQDWAEKLLAEVAQWDVIEGETAEQSMRRYLEQFPNAKGAELDQVVGSKFGASSGYGRKVAARWRKEQPQEEVTGSDPQ